MAFQLPFGCGKGRGRMNAALTPAIRQVDTPETPVFHGYTANESKYGKI